MLEYAEYHAAKLFVHALLRHSYSSLFSLHSFTVSRLELITVSILYELLIDASCLRSISSMASLGSGSRHRVMCVNHPERLHRLPVRLYVSGSVVYWNLSHEFLGLPWECICFARGANMH